MQYKLESPSQLKIAKQNSTNNEHKKKNKKEINRITIYIHTRTHTYNG
jgi:hypothetical protein